MYANPLWIPLTHDGGGNHAGLDFDPDTKGRPGQVIVFGRDMDTKRLVAPNFETFLDIFAAELRLGHLDARREGLALSSRHEALDLKAPTVSTCSKPRFSDEATSDLLAEHSHRKVPFEVGRRRWFPWLCRSSRTCAWRAQADENEGCSTALAGSERGRRVCSDPVRRRTRSPPRRARL